MKKKVLSLLLASAMVASMAACGNQSDTPSEGDQSSAPASSGEASSGESSASSEAQAYDLSEINVVVNGTLTANVENGQAEFVDQLSQAISEKMGKDITVNITQLDHSGYVDAVGRLFASGDYPDVMIMSADMFKQYAPTGLLWNMADAYDNAEFQNRMQLADINENLKDESGALYGFAPAYGNGCVTYVKSAWLESVGMAADGSDVVTYDDYYNMLLKFHNEDPDGNGTTGDTYGVIAAGYMGNEAPWINYLPEFWQGAYPALYQDESGEWVDGFQSEETKAALGRLRQAYVDGAIDPETLTASTKIAREKWFSNNQTGSSGAFTYWAGAWYNTLTNNLIKNEVPEALAELKPIQEIVDTLGGYLNREAPVWVIIDDGDGDDAREQAIFDAFIDTMLDGGRIQTLWTYGAEGVHWSTAADEGWKTNPGTDSEKTYGPYAEGEFHLLPSPNDANTVWSKNAMDPALVVSPLVGDYASFTSIADLAQIGNEFFTANCVDAPVSPASETYTEKSGDIYTAKLEVISEVVVNGTDVDTAMQDRYVSVVGDVVNQCLDELNNPAE